MINKKRESFNDIFLLVLIEKKQRSVFIFPYWVLKEYTKGAKTRNDFKKSYSCKVNKNNTITFGGITIPEKVVRKYSIQYDQGPLTKEELLKLMKGHQLQEVKKFPCQVLIYIVIAGILSSSLWTLIEDFFMNASFVINIFINFCLLIASILTLNFYYRNMKNNHIK